MRIEDAEALARSLMDANGLADWHIVWRSWVVVAGKCVRPLHWLVFSRPIVLLNDEPAVREVVLHEVAHALTNGEHDEAFGAMAGRLGCRSRGGMVIDELKAPDGALTEEEARMLSWRPA